MSETPDGWVETTSNEVCEYITSGSRDWKKYYSDEGAIFIRTQDINKDVLNFSNVAYVKLPEKVEGKRSRVEPGDILVTITGANVGKVAVVPDPVPEAYVSQSVGLMRLKDKSIAKFLHYYLQSEEVGRKHVLDMVYGMGRPVLSLQNLRDIRITLPPLPEQRRIVARIEELFSRLDAGVAALRHAKAHLQRYRQSVLAAAVTGQLTQAWREQHPDTEPAEELLKRILERRREEWNGRGKYTEPVDHDSSDLKELPESWTWSSFERVLTELRNGISKKPDATDGLRILRISAVRPLAVDLDDSRFLSDSLSKFATYELEPNDLLFTRYNGTRAFVGVCGLVPKLPEPFVYPDKLVRARLVDQNALLPSFVEIAMNAGESRQFLEKRIRTTAGQSGISGSDLKVTPLPIPPLAEQHQIVAEVEARTTAIDHLEAEIERQITSSNRLRQSTLLEAFSGKFF